MIINHNMNAMNAHRMMGGNTANTGKAMEKLSSGLRINRAGDDAAGLAISEKMRGQIRGLDQASRNGQDGISMIQTAEGALNETHSILQRMRELAVQSSNDTNVSVDRGEIQKEMDELAKEVTRIANNTEFNTQKLINGGIDANGIKAAKFHIGANSGQDIELSIKAMDAKSLGVSRDLVTATGTGAGNVKSATFQSTVGSKVVDGAVITFAYSKVNASPATASKVDGAANFTSADLSKLNADTNMTIKVGADTYTLTNTALKAWDDKAGHNAITDTTAFLGNAVNATGGKLSDVVNITNASGKISLEAKTAGANAITVNYNGTDIGKVAGVFGMADKLTNTGNAEVKPGEKITISNATGDNQVIDITDKAATSLKVTSGDYAGMTINTIAGQALKDLTAANDKVTVAATTTAATVTTFANNEKTADAVTEAGIDVSTQDKASKSITTIQTAIETVSAERSKLGAYQNRLEHTINNLGTSSENLQSAESRIRDVDMAKEMMNFSKNNILSQASQAMLAQAKSQPEAVLQLLR
ncbi:flagellin [Clostridium uliginosum]|uniref:Flagellin n=1 Tax=Clostridium uliginosum TaxID=119641 RepID=A0A1I1MNJ5_9CLOT|nr:flagellin [Clostridium uliginosum]SFC86715.1 flagellin [Clostridium uliginosum]